MPGKMDHPFSIPTTEEMDWSILVERGAAYQATVPQREQNHVQHP
jgi:hypothetical protein